MGSKFGVGNLAFQFGRQIYHAKSRGQVKFLLPRLRRKRILACFLGVSAKFTTLNPNPGSSAKVPQAKLSTAKLSWHQIPPPPPCHAHVCCTTAPIMTPPPRFMMIFLPIQRISDLVKQCICRVVVRPMWTDFCCRHVEVSLDH